MKAMKAEMGGAFLLAWAVTSMGGLGGDGVAYAICLAVAWMAFSGAHLLPVVTWCHIMTGDLGDVEGNWMANGMRLLGQVVGALLAVVLMTEADFGAGVLEGGDMWVAGVADNIWGAVGMLAAGAVFWQIHTRCDTAWVSAFAVLALGAAMGGTGAAEAMANSLADGASTTVNTAADWIVMSAVVGAGALLGVTLDDMMGEEE